MLTHRETVRKWILDSKEREYRELLTALSDAYKANIGWSFSQQQSFSEHQDEEDGYNKYFDKQNHAMRIYL